MRDGGFAASSVKTNSQTSEGLFQSLLKHPLIGPILLAEKSRDTRDVNCLKEKKRQM